MAKSNDQIRREYAAQSIPGQIGTAVGDIANIGVNAVSGGLFNRGIAALTGASDQQLADYERVSRVRAGLAGDVANVAGMVYGAGKALQGGKAALGAVRSLPTAAAVARTAGPATAARYLTNTAGPGLVPLATGPGAKASASVIAKGAGVLGLLGLSVAGRQEPGDASAVRSPAKPTAATAPAAAKQREITIADATAQDRSMAFLNKVLGSPLTLGEFERAASTMPTIASVGAKTPRIADVAGQRALAQSELIFGAQVKAAQDALASGDTDELGARKSVEEAFRDRYAREAALAGVNNQSEELAAILRGQQGGGE